VCARIVAIAGFSRPSRWWGYWARILAGQYRPKGVLDDRWRFAGSASCFLLSAAHCGSGQFFVLGDRFSGLVAIQPGHTLVTEGVYGPIRHPSYLGLLVNSLGWGLAFRSGVGVLLTALTIPPLLAQIGAEEKLLHTEFGDEYDAYRALTSRLVPGLY
jgi:protein-S-isoprenylcysteine O-methyltransferase Ste14